MLAFRSCVCSQECKVFTPNCEKHLFAVCVFSTLFRSCAYAAKNAACLRLFMNLFFAFVMVTYGCLSLAVFVCVRP